jgi:DNA repair exonuclease SbcCD ATPase subunit
MLTILSVNTTGFMSHGLEKTHTLYEQGLINLVGKNLDKGEGVSVGSGKTTLFNAITFCLYGKIETFVGGTVTGADELINESLNLGLCVRTEWLNHRGEQWRVTIARKWKGECPYPSDSPLYPYAGTDIYLEEAVVTDAVGHVSWVDRRAAESPKTRQRVRDAVGISYERFLATTYLTQNRGGLDFLKGTHANRMAILTDAINLGIWDQASGDFKVQKEQAETLLKSAEIEVGIQLASRDGARTKILTEQEVATTKHTIDIAQSKLEELQDKKKQISVYLEDLAKSLGQIQQGVNPYTAEITHLDAEASHKKQIYELAGSKLLADDPLLDAAKHRVTILNSDIQKASLNLGAFQSGKLDKCPTCGQPLNVNGAHLEAEVNRLISERDLALVELRYQEGVMVRRLIAQHIQLDNGLDTFWLDYEIKRSLAMGASSEWTASESSKNEALAHLAMQIQSAKNELVQTETVLQWYNNQLIDYNQRLKHHEDWSKYLIDVEVKLQMAQETLKGAKLEVLEWSWLQKFSGDKGFKAWKINEATNKLNERLSEALTDLDGSFQVWCKPYRIRSGYEYKFEEELTADEVVAEFTIYVKEGAKKEVPLYLYSGGESTMIAMAFLVAFWRLSDNEGQGTNLLLLDEVANALDEKSSQIITSFVQGLRTKGKTILMTSHNPLMDTIDFDCRWVVTKQGGISNLQEAA